MPLARRLLWHLFILKVSIKRAPFTVYTGGFFKTFGDIFCWRFFAIELPPRATRRRAKGQFKVFKAIKRLRGGGGRFAGLGRKLSPPGLGKFSTVSNHISITNLMPSPPKNYCPAPYVIKGWNCILSLFMNWAWKNRSSRIWVKTGQTRPRK